MYRYTQSFPASNTVNNINLFNIYRSVINNIFNYIPHSLFQTHIYDFKDNQKNIYTYKNGSLINRKEAGRIQLPSIQMEFTNRGNNTQDTVLEKMAPIQKMSGAYGIHSEMRGYNPFYADNFNIQMFSSDVFCRTDFRIQMAAPSLNDRNSIANILDTNLRQMYGTSIKNVKVQYLLPNNLLNFIREALFVKDLEIIRNNANNLSNEEIKKMSEKIDYEFVNHIERGSRGNIINVKISEYETNDINLAYTRFDNIYYKLNNQFSINEGEKRGELYEKYTLDVDGYIEYYSPISYIVNIPSVIKGEYTNKASIESYKPDPISGKLITKSYPSVYIEERYLGFLHMDLSEHDALIFEDREFLCDNGNDSYPILEKMLILYNSNPNSFKNSILEQVLFIYKHLDETFFEKIFKVYVWKDKELLKRNKHYDFDTQFNINLYDTNNYSVYSFMLYGNKSIMEMKCYNYLYDKQFE